MAIDDDFLKSMFTGMDGGAKLYGSDMAGHMPLLYVLGRMMAPHGEVVEIGIGNGFSTVALLAGVLSAGGRLHSYDLHPGCRNAALKTFNVRIEDERLKSWTFQAKDSLYAAQDFQDGSVALMFLDTVHTLEATRAELEAWRPKMSPRGVICGHDYFLKPGGVEGAVQEFLQKHHGVYRLQTLAHDQGFFILWPS